MKFTKLSLIPEDVEYVKNDRLAHNQAVFRHLGLHAWADIDEHSLNARHNKHLNENLVDKIFQIEGLTIKSPAGGYHPGHDSSSLFLLRHILPAINKPMSSILEIGVGSGAVLLALAARNRTGRCLGVDISDLAVRTASDNARLNDLNVEIRRSDVFEDIGPEKFDIILFNPPLLDKVPQNELERDKMCDPDGKLLLRFLTGVSQHLNVDGSAFVVVANISCLAPLEQSGLIISLAGAEIFDSGMIRALIKIRQHGFPGKL